MRKLILGKGDIIVALSDFDNYFNTHCKITKGDRYKILSYSYGYYTLVLEKYGIKKYNTIFLTDIDIIEHFEYKKEQRLKKLKKLRDL